MAPARSRIHLLVPWTLPWSNARTWSSSPATVRRPVESDLDYFLALEPALSFEFGDDGRRARPSEAGFIRRFGSLEPTFRADGLQVIGLNSTPRIRNESLERAAR